MNILLIGEYSNVHATLAEGLQQLGHHVVVASNGDFWKDYPRDIDLARDTTRKASGIRLVAKLLKLLPQWRGFDIVQLINPMFVELKAERIMPLYRYLHRHNRRIVLGAFGMDHYWVNTCSTDSPFKYSDFNIGNRQRDNIEAQSERKDWIGTAKEKLNKHIAHTADAIIAGLYEYWRCYQPIFPDKTSFIPLPINIAACGKHTMVQSGRLKVFIGIQHARNAYKGTDIMLAVAEEVHRQYPEAFDLIKAESVPFAQYQNMMCGCDILLDQLYSYAPSMNTLLAMQHGLVCIGGGEEEPYRLLGEDTLRPIVNVEPTEESVRKALTHLIKHPEEVQQRKEESIAFVNKYHSHLIVAQQYAKQYEQLLI